MTPDENKAKQVLWEIIRQAGGEMGKTKLFKAFWLAHLFYFKKAPGYLTDWPMVRMPNGPGIYRADRLLRELVKEGKLTIRHVPCGPFTEINCRVVGDSSGAELGPAALQAIKEAADYVQTHTAESISELSHDFSRSWKNLPDGAELNVYSDLIPDDAYHERTQELRELKQAYEELFEE